MKQQIIITEEQTHRMVCQYLKLKYPKVMFNSDMSGVKLTMGQAKKAASLRSNKAYPDIIIYQPCGNFAGLFVELKRPSERIFKKDGSLVANEHIKDQYEVIMRLRERGYMAEFAIGYDMAVRIIDHYLSL